MRWPYGGDAIFALTSAPKFEPELDDAALWRRSSSRSHIGLDGAGNILDRDMAAAAAATNSRDHSVLRKPGFEDPHTRDVYVFVIEEKKMSTFVISLDAQE